MKLLSSAGKSHLSLLCVLIFLVIASIWVLHLEKQPQDVKRLPSGINEQDIENEQRKISDELAVQTVKPVSWKTRNGARVYFIPANELPMVDIVLKFDAGSARDGKYFGLANLTGKMLNQGAGDMTAEDVAREFERLGAIYKCCVRCDFAMISLKSLSEKSALLPATALLTKVVSRPVFSQHTLTRIKNQIQAEIRYRKKLPVYQAERIFWKTLYAGHPYGHTTIGNEKSITSMERQQLQAFHQQHYVARNLVIALTGNIDEETARMLADNISAPLASGEPLAPFPQPTPLKAVDQCSVIMDTKQTHICLGQLGISRSSPDYIALKVANHILECKRLYPEVRAHRGLSYEVSSTFTAMKVAGPFMIRLQTRNDHASEALAVVYDVLKEFVENGITQEELDAARSYVRGSYPLSRANNSAMVVTLSKMGYFELPLEYMDWYIWELQQLTVEQVNQVIKRQLVLEALLEVTVGRDVIPAANE